MKWDKTYTLKIHPDLKKSIKKNLPENLKKVLDCKLSFLSNNPNHPSLNCKEYIVSRQTKDRLEADNIYEFYINKSYRCIFYVITKEKWIVIAFVGDHNEVKKKLS